MMQRFLHSPCQEAKMKEMKNISIAALLSFVMLSAFTCRKNETPDNTYRGKLVKKGICMNYTISVVGGNIDKNLVEATWTDPNTNTSYTNAFRLESICDFPSGLNEGDEFSFVINNSAPMNCAQCMAYYPTPQKGLRIKVVASN
jgi:hypothetical protein